MTDFDPQRLLVVARFKPTSEDAPPKLTGNVPLKELLEEVESRIPVDRLYTIVEGPGGFSLRELGSIRVEFFPAQAPSLPPPEPESQESQELAHGEDILPTPIPPARPAPESRTTARPEPRVREKPRTTTPPQGLSEDPEDFVVIPATPESEKEASLFGKIRTWGRG